MSGLRRHGKELGTIRVCWQSSCKMYISKIPDTFKTKPSHYLPEHLDELTVQGALTHILGPGHKNTIIKSKAQLSEQMDRNCASLAEETCNGCEIPTSLGAAPSRNAWYSSPLAGSGYGEASSYIDTPNANMSTYGKMSQSVQKAKQE